MTASPRSFSFRFRSVFTVVAAICAMTGFAGNARAESPMPHTTHTTMVVFSDRPLDDGQWSALASRLHRAQAEAASFIPVIGPDIDVDVVRGRDASPGLTALERISIFLKGDCRLLPRSRTFVQGALGWVNVIQGKIHPYIYVDCERIEEMLGPLALSMNREKRNAMMAEAISRVVLHEWVHVATQDGSHEKVGVMKSQFGISDLLIGDGRMNPCKHGGRTKEHSTGF